MSRLFLSLFFLGVIALSYADTCLESPPSLKPKEVCAGTGVGCVAGHYCDSKGYCSPYKVANEACALAGECITGTTCKGSPSAKKCVVNANPGENCNSTMVSDVPSCGIALLCTFNGTCTNGRIGDKCTLNSDCSNGFNCTGGFCKGFPVGEICFGSSSLCDSGLFCDTSVTPSACKAFLTSGKCNSNGDCTYGYTCIGASDSDASQCVKWGTRKVGEYCSNENRLCEGDMRCLSGFCVEGTPKHCTSGSSGQCPANKHCTCNSNRKSTGFGSCTPNPCYELSATYDECIFNKCKGSAFWDYTNSCANLNCKDQYAKSSECNPAVRIAVSVLVLIASLITLFI